MKLAKGLTAMALGLFCVAMLVGVPLLRAEVGRWYGEVPGSVWIAGVEWTIVGEDLDEGMYGVTWADERKLVYAHSLNAEVRRATIYHEQLHAELETMLRGHPDDEEACTQAHETAGLSVLRDPRNHAYVSYLRSVR